MPDYEGESRELTLDKSMSYSMFTYDVLRVTIPSSPIKSVSTSKEDMLTIFYDEGSHEITVMSEVTGKVKITVRTSNGKKLVLALTINDPYVPKTLSVTRKKQARRRRQRLCPLLTARPGFPYARHLPTKTP
ncbi:MAG: hypothetical protein IJI71_11145 [Clostridia bacterium]|nr:hypothetical protein [Clostridia bacterium]